MLQLKSIKKDYPAGDGTVHALKGIDLQFRESEFVSILGPSGCGKTTMLNIICGLDQYTSGDLVINGVSTKSYKDRDWDAYRNHSIGFVFQSYNLIPHQSVLQNVELSLSLSGISKAERRRRAKEALERVGLGNQLRKRPSEMSGGQMQRVAIARAIVNNPDIILADEPTGALDTETSVQVMDILKEISKDRLVIMVTHNPDIAEKYSTRIIRMLDGEITDDSAPLTKDEIAREQIKEKAKAEQEKKTKKPSMKIWTSFGLSLKNLFTKKGRTILTSFAGSIGIIGIALIFAVSQGMTTYIDTLQEDTLSSYPLTLEGQQMDMGSLLATFMGQAQSGEEHENDKIYQKTMVYDLVNALNNMETKENDLKSFKKYLETEMADETSILSQAINGIQ
ncbi:MAG: ABC transporter ATP-binding protein, partial [Lachnospiraceae bacterium]|nr:ABC transporter ATP-binding protein [Lachnospiraceae bacterium]